jgi:4-amino-4-deoxy-L-arabinose transferase-like glycosyltransferase
MSEKRSWIYDVLFILVLMVAGYLRIAGYNWGEGQHQHPDELFLSGVLDNLRAKTCIDESIGIDNCPVEQQRWMSLGQYFDASTSTLSPYNRGHAFFVYGNFPMVFTRIVYEVIGSDEVGNLKFFARQLSAIADLFTVFLLYLMASKMYGRKIGLFAATFSSFAVMQIQQSHFFTADTFLLMFMTLTLWFAVSILENREQRAESSEQDIEVNSSRSILHYALSIIHSPLFLLTIGFGFALGLAMASKINAAVLALVLPLVFFVRYLTV